MMPPIPVTDLKDFRLLVEVHGPFVSTGVLRDTFPQGFPKEDTHGDDLRRLRLAYEGWRDAAPFDVAAHNAWLRFVLSDVLEFDQSVLATGQTIPQSLRVHVSEARSDVTPDLLVTTHPEEDLLGETKPGRPLVPVFFHPRIQKLDKPFATEPNARLTPIDRAVAFLRGSSFPVGLVANGEQWTTVHAPQEGVTSTATWYAEMWVEEPVTVRGFRALLGARRWFHAEANSTLPKLLERSALNQGAVTAQLGRQVRQAVELLILALDRADQDKSRGLLSGIPEPTLYEAALTVMMRLVFLFFAEERELLPASDPLYAGAYAVSTIREQLQATADRFGAEVLERRNDAWNRLLATFRAVHAGLGHDRLTLPAYGGQLFDPDRYCFLEGRPEGTSWRDTPAAPLPVDNRTILYALKALQILRERGSEPRQLTFRELDVPDIGHVYESLLDHTAKRASVITLGLVGREGEEAEIELTQLEEWLAAGEDRLVRELMERTEKAAKSLRNLLTGEVDVRLRDRMRTACRGDEAVLVRVLPFANLVRNDPWGHPVLILRGSVHVTAGTDRRSTGTHYTPASLTEPIVQYTLEPVVYDGPAEGKPREEWRLKSASDLLKLKVCDLACGSGAFLVAACRYLAARLQEAWAAAGAFQSGTPRRSPEGFESTGAPDEDLIPLEPEAREAYALRVVAQRCLYGVDKNPLAAEMAKLSLWLLTLAKGKPFTFVDHAIKSGDSLIGVNREQLETFDLDGIGTGHGYFIGALPTLQKVSHLRELIADTHAETVADVERQGRLLQEAKAKTEALTLAADTLIGMELKGVDAGERVAVGAELGILLIGNSIESVREIAERYSVAFRPFHWSLEFPEVFEQRRGFDALLGNPPFMAGTSISSNFGSEYKRFILKRWPQFESRADLCTAFLLSASEVCNADGTLGLVASNTLAQTDSRQSGLAHLLDRGLQIYRARKSFRWPGSASVYICNVHLSHRRWRGDRVLDGTTVQHIDSFLDPTPHTAPPYRLSSSAARSHTGTKVYGDGFILSLAEAQTLLVEDRYERVVKPYLVGKELNEDPLCRPSRYIIDFTDMSEEQARQFPLAWAIVEARVKKDRQNAPEPRMREVWWQFQRPRKKLYHQLHKLGRAWLIAATSDTVAFVGIPVSALEPIIFSHAVNVLTLQSAGDFAVLQSSLHSVWARRYGSSMKQDFRYTTTDCLENFPFPSDSSGLDAIARQYHEERTRVMKDLHVGLTGIAAALNDPAQSQPAVLRLRDLHIRLDAEVLRAYGWQLDLGHSCQETRRGLRFTICAEARVKVLDRLLALNHERYAAEQQPAMKRPRAARAPRASATRPLLGIREP